ncbi:MAG: oligosaccharide flippase family protein, partial [Ignavibacteriales bacterium]|nr:oligosaccharide flippase family protein [Ignavibacteriales bacterium]
MPNMLKQLTKESLVYGLSAVATRFINIVMIPLYTRVFSPEDYGVMSLVITTMTI